MAIRTSAWCFILVLLSAMACNSASRQRAEQQKSLFTLGLKCDSAGDYRKSIVYYNDILATDTLYMGALINRGRAFALTGKPKEALSDLNKAVKYWPGYHSYLVRALLLLSQNTPDSAENDLKKALIYNPKSTEAYCLYCRLHLLKKEYLPALYCWQFATELRTNPALATTMRAILVKELGDSVVLNYSNAKIESIVNANPLVAKANERFLNKYGHSLSLNMRLDTGPPALYIIGAEGQEENINYIFRMNAASLKILNPGGK